ncbi:hypothetical protein HMPREF1212_05035 [Parabacteroides sp. HGS0025]|uniref:DUF5119 domain-containing protein n=1 Tax=Parabacteroides sp. HGS0025 TaxID=1078087 RepID=UPI000616EBD9|nr:DUF5119 domain-containing protein [Parabacteroides sp. HGS0025]KKB45879.1 hypothetical protein HMPREF1212_05035 [Parabacteroides sp. HGS0025]
MKRTTIHYIYILSCTALFLLLSVSCERRELTYFLESEITVEADWSHSGLSETGYGATALFYPAEGGAPLKALMGNRERTTVRLPEGRYRVLIFNRSYDDFSYVGFAGDSFYNFRALAKKVEARVVVDTPEEVAAAAVEEFEVTEDMLGNYDKNRSGSDPDSSRYTIRFEPAKVTKQIKVEIRVPGLNNLRSAVGRIENICESVCLSTGKGSEEKVTQQFVFDKMEFDPGSPFDGMISGSFNVFGFDRKLAHRLTIQTLLVDGKTRTEETFDTDPEYILQEDGSVLIRIRLTAKKLPDVKPEGVPDSGFDVDVDEWGDPEEVELPL